MLNIFVELNVTKPQAVITRSRLRRLEAQSIEYWLQSHKTASGHHKVDTTHDGFISKIFWSRSQNRKRSSQGRVKCFPKNKL